MAAWTGCWMFGVSSRRCFFRVHLFVRWIVIIKSQIVCRVCVFIKTKNKQKMCVDKNSKAAKARLARPVVRDGRQPGAEAVPGQAAVAHGGARDAAHGVPDHLKDTGGRFPPLCPRQGERGLPGGMSGTCGGQLTQNRVFSSFLQTNYPEKKDQNKTTFFCLKTKKV